jgi:molybdopterin-binding protein
LRKNGKSQANIAELLKVRDAALRLGIGFPNVEQWIYNKKIRSDQTARGIIVSHRAKSDWLLFRAPGKKPATQRRKPPRECSKIESVPINGLMAEARVSIGGQQITPIITARSVTEMQRKRGPTAAALITVTDVMILRVDS